MMVINLGTRIEVLLQMMKDSMLYRYFKWEEMVTKIEKPTRKEQDKIFKLRCQSKIGVRLHSEGISFIEQMFTKYPEWYKLTEVAVFNKTVSFGSNVKLKKVK